MPRPIRPAEARTVLGRLGQEPEPSGKPLHPSRRIACRAERFAGATAPKTYVFGSSAPRDVGCADRAIIGLTATLGARIAHILYTSRLLGNTDGRAVCKS